MTEDMQRLYKPAKEFDLSMNQVDCKRENFKDFFNQNYKKVFYMESKKENTGFKLYCHKKIEYAMESHVTRRNIGEAMH